MVVLLDWFSCSHIKSRKGIVKKETNLIVNDTMPNLKYSPNFLFSKPWHYEVRGRIVIDSTMDLLRKNPGQKVSAQKVSGHKVSKMCNIGQKVSTQKVSGHKVSSHKVSKMCNMGQKVSGQKVSNCETMCML